MKVGEAAWRQGGAAGGELQESLPLGPRHLNQDIDEAEEAGRLLRVAQFGLRVLDYLLAGEHRVLRTTVSPSQHKHLRIGYLIAAQHGADLLRSEAAQPVEREHRVEAVAQRLQLCPHPPHQRPVHRPATHTFIAPTRNLNI